MKKALSFILLLSSLFASAQFQGAYDVSNWTLSNDLGLNGTVDTSGMPNSFTLTGTEQTDGGDTNYTITIPSTTLITFDWHYTTTDFGPEYDYPNVVVNGNKFLFDGYDKGGSTDQSGSMTVSVYAGDSFAFNIYSTDGCCGAASVTISNFTPSVVSPITWTGTNSSDWNDSGNWSTNSLPTATSAVTIEPATNQPVISSNVSVFNLTLAATTTLTVNSGFNLTVRNYIHNSGTLTVENNANLIQVDAVVNTDNIIVKRNSAPIVRLDHTLWSAPVTGQNLFAFSPATLTNRFYTYNTSTNAYTNTGLDATSNFIAGKGFAIRAPDNQTALTPTSWEGTFTGIPNNGTIPFTLDATTPGYNLVGNPYPSTISAANFVAANSNITGTLYFYAHSLSMNANGTFPAGTNYAVWNSLGSTAATTATGGDVHLTPEVPNGIIQVGQGFLVKASTAETINFTNAMRVANNANQSFRSTTVEKDRFWLNLKTAAGVDINQILVGYVSRATQGVDRNYDGLAYGNTGSFISSKIEGADYAIQGRSLPFDSSDTVPLGFKAATAGDFAIALTKSDGLFAGNQEVFLKDNLTGNTHNIKVSPYTFSSQAGTFDTRFSLVYTPSLAVPSNSFTPNSVVVYKADEWHTIKTNGIVMKDVSVYDMAGRLIYQQSVINADTTVLKGLSQANGVRLVKIVSQENETVTVKIIN